MAYVQVGDRQHPLVPGENGIGSVAEARVPVPSGPDGVQQMAAVIVVDPDGSIAIHRAGESEVRVNGVHLGAEPTPLIHGDKIEIGSTELFFGDDRKGGNTRFVTAVKRPEPASRTAGVQKAATGAAVGSRSATGGRLVSLVDGREYVVPDSGLVLGRDPTCDVVVPTGEVSRKHAVITVGADGYAITDMSANGLSVNGDRVASSSRLVRGDVIKVGGEEFRFHADAAPERPVLATLDVKSTGVLQGRSFEIRSPLTHLGRGTHNDVVLADESVSDSHAKLQSRDDGWYVVDMGSTNGTYVGGRRILGEARLEGAPDLRVGGIKFIFRATGADAGASGAPDALAAGASAHDAGAGAGQTRAIAALTPEERARLLASAGAGRAEGTSRTSAGAGDGESRMGHEREVGVAGGREEPLRRRRPSLLFWIVVIAAAAIAVVLLLR